MFHSLFHLYLSKNVSLTYIFVQILRKRASIKIEVSHYVLRNTNILTIIGLENEVMIRTRDQDLTKIFVKQSNNDI